jgi:unsaturated rhamnogalacturonyl hydrolase
MKKLLLLAFITIPSLFSPAQTTYGVQFSDAIISRWPSGINSMTSKGWEYSNSIVLLGMANVYEKTNDAAYLAYIKTYIDGYIGTDGTGVSTSLAQNLDKIHPGMLCLWLYEKTGTLKYKTAATTIRNYLLKTGTGAYPRTPENGFWHKNNSSYTNVMMCDGIYMASPFLAKYGALFNDAVATDEAAFQTMIIYSHVYNASNKLVYHAWNYDKTTYTWSNATTGVSSQVWSRGMGWYMMALVDILEYLPTTHPSYTEIKTALQNLCQGLKTYQDASTGLWYQVVQNPTGAGNWIETTGSGMYIYAMKKAINNNLIDATTYTPVVNNAWTGMKTYVKTYSDGKPQITSFAPAMGVLATYNNYISISPTSCPGSSHPHGYCAILMASALMEYNWLNTSNFKKSIGVQLFNTETKLNIVVTDGKSGTTAIKIYDLKGGNLISTTSTEQNIVVNIATLPQGVYVCAIERDGKTTSDKFIKK